MNNFNYMCLKCKNYVQTETMEKAQKYLRTHKNNCLIDSVTDELLQQRLERNKKTAHISDRYVEVVV